MTIEVRVAPGNVCDFCSSDDPQYREGAATFEVQITPQTTGESVGDWASCATCHELIARRDWKGLEKRAVRRISRKHPELPQSMVRQGVHDMQIRFRSYQS